MMQHVISHLEYYNHASYVCDIVAYSVNIFMDVLQALHLKYDILNSINLSMINLTWAMYNLNNSLMICLYIINRYENVYTHVLQVKWAICLVISWDKESGPLGTK